MFGEKLAINKRQFCKTFCRFGGGYTVTVRVDAEPQEVHDVIELMNVAFPGITLKVLFSFLIP